MLRVPEAPARPEQLPGHQGVRRHARLPRTAAHRRPVRTAQLPGGDGERGVSPPAAEPADRHHLERRAQRALGGARVQRRHVLDQVQRTGAEAVPFPSESRGLCRDLWTMGRLANFQNAITNLADLEILKITF